MDDCRRRRAEGDDVTDEAIIAAHPELMPELGEEMRKLRIIAAARARAAAPSDSDGNPTIEHTPTRKDSRGLRIRCPHCSNFVEILTDTPYEEICCSTCGSTFSLIDRDESTRMAAPLKSIGRFDLITRLGIGGFGTVWKAHDRELDRTVAIKIPRRGQLSHTEIDQFFREARAAAQLRHRNIVQVHEVGRDSDTLFIVSDFVRGVTLTDWLTGGRTSSKEVVELCVPIAEALSHAHQHGVVHRDLKPSNILIDEAGQPHLTDFGLAKREVGEITMTIDGQVLGTPAYMSPEQARGQAHWVDRRTDIYSLGVILFQLLTGELTFRGDIEMQRYQKLTADAPDPRKLNRHIPRDLAAICLKCLEREPGRRYDSAGELVEEFRRFLRREPVQARLPSAPGRLIRWANRKPMTAASAGLVLFLAVAGPSTAIHIARQRAQLEVRFSERGQLIDRSAEEARRAGLQIEDLRKQLDVWEGRGNPSEFWPPRRDNLPRTMVIANLFAHSNAELRNQLRAGRFEREKTARGYLGLAAMAEVLGKSSTAREYFQLARDQLIALLQANPQDPQFARALAECYSRLALLDEKNDRDQAAMNFENARAIYEQLATKHSTHAQFQVDWLESEVKSATLKGAVAAKDRLAGIEEINKALASTWPGDPDEVYRLVCYFTQTEPILSQAAAPATQ
ncbi:MAG: protein kinase [Pirellulales bacterium]